MPDTHRNNQSRVVITGLGAVSALGVGVDRLWEGLVNAESGIGNITQFDTTNFDCRIAGEATGFDPAAFMPLSETRRMARASQLAVAAAKEAWQHAELDQRQENSERIGVLLGSGMGGWEKADSGTTDFRNRSSGRAKPFALAASLPNMPAFSISHYLQAHGPMAGLSSACATGTQCIGEAAEMIRRGATDVMIAGGVEGLVTDFIIAGFAGMRAMPTAYNDDPQSASRPFDIDRSGFVLSEGCGAVILESYDHAIARNAPILAEVLGYAASADGYHIAKPEPSGIGAERAMRWALDNAQVNPTQIDYINAHGSSTPINDVLETNAIKRVFGAAAYNIPVSSTKSMIGHPLGGSGALEAIACVQSLTTSIIHPTRNLDTPDPACDLDYIPHTARQHDVNITLSNSFGLGGQNACLVLGKVEQ